MSGGKNSPIGAPDRLLIGDDEPGITNVIIEAAGRQLGFEALAIMTPIYDGTQQGDPAKLSEVLVKIAGMENPPKQFLAGSDAVAVAKPTLEWHLQRLAVLCSRGSIVCMANWLGYSL